MGNCTDVLILLPGDFELLNMAVKFVLAIRSLNKNVTVVIPASLNFNELALASVKRIDFSETDFGLFKFPKKALLKKLSDKEFDLVIDLNYGDYSVLSLLANVPAAKYRAGFSKISAERFYNLMFISSAQEGNRYDELLNMLTNL